MTKQITGLERLKMTETLNGLHSCKPQNEPKQGEIKTFVIEQRKGKSGKDYLKIKSAGAQFGGTPYRILSAEPTGYTDDHGNVSFNLEIESATLSGGDGLSPDRSTGRVQPSSPSQNAPESPPAHLNGVDETRAHIMKSANLYVLCVNAVNKYVAAHLPEVAQTSEQFQAAVGTLFIEASSRRTSDGIVWWSYVDKMPERPIE